MVDVETIKKIAQHSCIHLHDHETTRYAKECTDILNSFSQLQELNTDNIEPALHPVHLFSQPREDIPEQGLTQQEALQLAAHKTNKHFIGPKTL